MSRSLTLQNLALKVVDQNTLIQLDCSTVLSSWFKEGISQYLRFLARNSNFLRLIFVWVWPRVTLVHLAAMVTLKIVQDEGWLTSKEWKLFFSKFN